jgi:hypothetical protein
MFAVPATETRLVDLNTAGRIVIMQSLAILLPGRGWTAINLLEQEHPVHRDDCSYGNMLTGETGQYFMHQFGHFQSVCVWSDHGMVDIS